MDSGSSNYFDFDNGKKKRQYTPFRVVDVWKKVGHKHLFRLAMHQKDLQRAHSVITPLAFHMAKCQVECIALALSDEQ